MSFVGATRVCFRPTGWKDSKALRRLSRVYDDRVEFISCELNLKNNNNNNKTEIIAKDFSCYFWNLSNEKGRKRKLEIIRLIPYFTSIHNLSFCNIL